MLKAESRNRRFNPNQPVALAGSDLISFFLYERDPVAKTEIIIASNNADVKAPVIRQELAKVLGLPQAQIERGPSGPPIAQVTGKPASAALAQVAADFVKAVNAADKQVLRVFITDRFVNGPEGPTVEERLDRLSALNGNLGKLEIIGVTIGEDGALQVQMKTAKEPQATLMMYTEPQAPYKIQRLSLMVGGG